MNPYYRYIENIIVDEKQFKIAWYVDNNKASHVEKKVNTKRTRKISEHFGRITVSRGTENQLLGMYIYFRKQKRIVLMKDYIEESIELFDEILDTTVSLLAKKGLKM